MKLSSIILLSVAVAFTMIGIHRVVMERDIISNYWIFMISFVCLMWYRVQNPRVK